MFSSQSVLATLCTEDQEEQRVWWSNVKRAMCWLFYADDSAWMICLWSLTLWNLLLNYSREGTRWTTSLSWCPTQHGRGKRKVYPLGYCKLTNRDDFLHYLYMHDTRAKRVVIIGFYLRNTYLPALLSWKRNAPTVIKHSPSIFPSDLNSECRRVSREYHLADE